MRYYAIDLKSSFDIFEGKTCGSSPPPPSFNEIHFLNGHESNKMTIFIGR